MNEQSLGLQKLSSISPAESSDINVDLDANLITKMSDNNNNTSKTNKKQLSNDNDEMDTDDASAPFKANNNDLINLASSSNNDDTNKTINRRSHGKSLFKSIFCCFSTSLHRNNKSSTKNKNSSFINSTNFNNPCNANSSNNLNNNSTTTNNNNINNTVTSNSTSNTTTSTTPITPTNNNNNDIINLNNINKESNSTDNSQVKNNSNGINNNNNNTIIVNNVNNSTNNNSNINNNNNNNAETNSFQLSNYSYNPSYPSYRDNYPHERYLLPPVNPIDSGKKCLIIDLDETLVHSSFKQVNNADFIVPVEIDGIIHQVYVLKRPYVDEFLKKMGQLYECVLFTASLAKYADPVADLLDKWGVFRYRLFREACVYYRGNYVKDLGRLGRDLNKVVILDNSPASYIFHPNNAVSCISWFDDMNDTELNDLIPHFERLATVDSVYSILKQSNTPSISNSTFNNQYQPQSVVYTSNLPMNNYEDDLNQQVPIIQSQSVIYQVQSPLIQSPTNSNMKTSDENSNNNNFNYILNENKILLSIDLMMATKQQQLDQENKLELEKNQS